jgi:hypothetical protein
MLGQGTQAVGWALPTMMQSRAPDGGRCPPYRYVEEYVRKARRYKVRADAEAGLYYRLAGSRNLTPVGRMSGSFKTARLAS